MTDANERIGSMKTHGTRHRAGGFSLIELLCVIAIISILAALLMSALSQAQARAHRIKCVSNLREVGVASQSFAHEHGNRFPMQVPADEGGSQEFLQAAYQVNGDFYFSYHHFQTLSNELVTPKLLLCPADTRLPAACFATLSNNNLSYFVAAYARLGDPNAILAGDRNLTNNSSTPQSRLRLGPSNSLYWTRELHQFKGNVLFADGHVEEMNNAGLLFTTTNGLAAVVVFLPTVRSAGTETGGGGLAVGAATPDLAASAPAYTLLPTSAPTPPHLPLILTPGRGIGSSVSGSASPAATPTVAPPEFSPATGVRTAVMVGVVVQTNAVVVPAAAAPESGSWDGWLWLLLGLFLLLLLLRPWFRRRENR